MRRPSPTRALASALQNMMTENCTLSPEGCAVAQPDPKKKIVRAVQKDYIDHREKTFANAHNPLILQIKLEELMKYTHIALQQFPKMEKYQLCADIKAALYTAMHLTIQMEKRYYKKTTLQDLDIAIEELRVLVRLAFNLKYISAGHLNDWMSQVDEAGKIVGGLIKTFKDK